MNKPCLLPPALAIVLVLGACAPAEHQAAAPTAAQHSVDAPAAPAPALAIAQPTAEPAASELPVEPTSDAQVAGAPSAMASAAPKTCFSFAPRSSASDKGWYPIHDGVQVTRADDSNSMTVAYHRARGKAAGVAFDLAPDSCTRLGEIQLRLSAAAKQRVWVCLTDSQGVVWSFPSIQLGKDMTDVTLAAKDLRADPFQNAGKQVPAQPDWKEMRMLTLLDTSGFMGAAAVDCSWRIESLRGVEARP